MEQPINFAGIRATLGLKQTELAVKLKVAQGDLSNWETGKHRPSKLAERALRIALDDLLVKHAKKQQRQENAA